MTRDDELRSRISGLAEEAEIGEVTVEKVRARGRRRNLNQRIVALAAAFVLMVGVAGVVRTISDDEGTLDVAVEAGPEESDEAEGSAGVDDEAGAEEAGTAASNALVRPAAGFAGDDAAFGSYEFEGGGGPSWVLPWGDGFVSFGQVWHAPTAAMGDLVPDLAERFPPEITAALEEAGVDSANIEESMAALEKVGLLDLATEIVQSDPELFDAYMAATSGTSTFEAQISDDGINWTDLANFSPPGELGFVQSDGIHLVMANQVRNESETTGIEVSITTDLVTWTTVAIPVVRPASVPEFATVNSGLGSFAIGPDGWYATVERHSYVDLWSLLPDDLREEMEQNGWGYTPTAEGLRLESYGRELYEDGDEGFDYPVIPAASSSYPVVPPPIPLNEEPWPSTLEKLVPWTDLGIGYDDYAAYMSGSSESVGWVGSWAGDLFQAAVPRDSACCTVVGTDAGYLAMAWDDYESERLEPNLSTALHFSPDGHTWTAVTTPATGFIDSLVAVQGGVLLSTSDESGQTLWRGEADGTAWRQVEVPGVPNDTWLWFGQGGHDGVASIIDVATYDYRDPPPLVGLDFTLKGLTYEGHITVSDDALIHLTITYAETGEIAFDDVSDWEAFDSSAVIEFLFLGFSAVDEDLPVELDEDFDRLWDTLAAAERAVREEQGWVEPTYEPDFWLVASRDGLSWHVEDLPANPDQYYNFSSAAINGATLAVQMNEGWLSFDIG